MWTRLNVNKYRTASQKYNNYRPLSEASEGYVFTGVCHSFCSTVGGGEGRWSSTPMVNHHHHHPPPPPSGPSQNVYPLPPPFWTRSECLPPPSLDQVRMSTPPPLRTKSECLPPPPPSGPGQNVYPLPPRLHAGGAVRILLECILVHEYFWIFKPKRTSEQSV